MSIRYKDNLISPLPNIIDDKTPAQDKIYSSAYIEAYIAYLNKELADIAGEIKPSVKGVVGTFADLATYDIDKLQEKDVIYVLADETHDGYTSYYRWDGTNFNYIGSLSPYYTPAQVDNLLDDRQDKLESTVNIKTINGTDILGPGDITIDYTLDDIYPVGSVYMCKDLTIDPNTEFGGTWKLEETGNILYSTTGEIKYDGKEKVALTADNLPPHTHMENAHTHTGTTNGLRYNIVSSPTTTYQAAPLFRAIGPDNNDGQYDDFELGKSDWTIIRKTDTDWIVTRDTNGNSLTATGTTNAVKTIVSESGYSDAHDNRPPWLGIAIWHRIA